MSASVIPFASMHDARKVVLQLVQVAMGSHTKASGVAATAGYEFLMQSLTAEERAKVLSAAQEQQIAAPPGSFPTQYPPVETYEEAVALYGTSLIAQVLGN
ncbi:hypothetical protein ABIC83_002379 [Roseateles asaccharophilus]|uniref:hypothetical protein n=1 Tax=Roseateles asaccharophilus TaxID=582607 RepID=UPI003836A64C